MSDSDYGPIIRQMREELDGARTSHAFWLKQPPNVVPSPTGVEYDFRKERLRSLHDDIVQLEDAIALLERPHA